MRLELSSIGTATTASTVNTLLATLRVGAIIEATAIRDVSDGQLWLSIGASQVPARIASGNVAGPANGEKLQLRVLRDRPVLALETVESNDETAVAVDNGLRRYLPRQASPAPLLSNLAWLATHSDEDSNAPKIDRAVKEAALRLWQALPDATELTNSKGLSDAVKRSGVFLEANLAATLGSNDAADNGVSLTRDIKALLITLKQVLISRGANGSSSEQTAPAPVPTLRGPLTPLSRSPATLSIIDAPAKQINELASQTDGALARLNTVQLINTEAPTAALTWMLELPIRRDNHPETIRFRFERGAAHPDTPEQSWSVEAALNLGSSGALHARVSLLGKRIGVQLRADPPELVSQLSAQAPLLSSMLRDAGLEVDRVICLHGMPANTSDVRVKSLLDIHV